MKPSDFIIFILVEIHDEKTAENYRNCYVAEKLIVSKLSQILVSQIEDMNKDYVKIPGPYFVYFPRKKPLKSVTVGPGRVGSDRFIVLNDSASPKWS